MKRIWTCLIIDEQGKTHTLYTTDDLPWSFTGTMEEAGESAQEHIDAWESENGRVIAQIELVSHGRIEGRNEH